VDGRVRRGRGQGTPFIEQRLMFVTAFHNSAVVLSGKIAGTSRQLRFETVGEMEREKMQVCGEGR
jgi:hypothetical protein